VDPASIAALVTAASGALLGVYSAVRARRGDDAALGVEHLKLALETQQRQIDRQAARIDRQDRRIDELEAEVQACQAEKNDLATQLAVLRRGVT